MLLWVAYSLLKIIIDDKLKNKAKLKSVGRKVFNLKLKEKDDKNVNLRLLKLGIC